MPTGAGQLVQYFIQAVILLLIVLLMRMFKNGGTKTAATASAAEEPGRGEICQERGEQLEKHKTELEHLVKDLDEEKEDRKQFRKEISTKIGNVHKELRRMNGAK